MDTNISIVPEPSSLSGESARAQGDGRGDSAGRRSTVRKNAAGKLVSRRKVKPKQLAVVTDACTGCAGAPVCQIYCPVDDCMVLVTSEAPPFLKIEIDPLRCVGCRKCVSAGPEDSFLDGCPWDALYMVATAQWEAEHGELPY